MSTAASQLDLVTILINYIFSETEIAKDTAVKEMAGALKKIKVRHPPHLIY